jgi:hypothetical protein
MRGRPLAYGFFGALIGSVVGTASLLLLTAEVLGGDNLGAAFMLFFGFPFFAVVGAVLGIVLSLRVLRYLSQEDQEGLLILKKKRLKLGLIFGVPALIIGMPWFAFNRLRPPSDHELIANFRQHQSEFEQLAAMVQTEKGLTQVDETWTAPHNPQEVGVSKSRIAEYRRLLRSVGTPRGFQTWGIAGDIKFYYYLTGSAVTSDTDKGYAYMTMPPAHLLKSLDHCQPDGRKEIGGYRHIQGNWYLFYEYIPG